MFSVLLIKGYSFNCTYKVVVLIYTCKFCFINPSSQIAYSCFRLFGEIHLLSGPDNREFTAFCYKFRAVIALKSQLSLNRNVMIPYSKVKVKLSLCLTN
jgi:hypothetical protein